MTRVVVDRSACVGSGQCVMVAPDVFDQGEDDALVELLQPSPPPGQLAAVRDAVTGCPARAIALVDDA